MSMIPLKGGEGQETSGQTEELGTGGGHGGSTLEWLDGGSRGSDTSSVGWGLWLTVRDLGHGSGGGGLNLSIRDLGDWGTSGGLGLSVGDLSDWGTSGSLGLAIRDLGDWGAGGCLWLSVRDLGNWGTSGCLWLSVGNLGDWDTGGSLRLAVGDLGNWGGSDLSVGDLGGNGHGGGGRSGTHDVNVDLGALGTGGLVVEVVEGTAEALVEDGGAAESDGSVAASRPSSGVDGTSLGRSVKLELLVGGDVSSSAFGIGHDTVVEGDDERSGSLSGARGGHVNDGDLEGTGVAGRASCRGALLWCDSG